MKYFNGIIILSFGIYYYRFSIKDKIYEKKNFQRKKTNLLNFIIEYLSKYINFLLRIKAHFNLFFHYFLVNQTNQGYHEIYIYSNCEPCISN